MRGALPTRLSLKRDRPQLIGTDPKPVCDKAEAAIFHGRNRPADELTQFEPAQLTRYGFRETGTSGKHITDLHADVRVSGLIAGPGLADTTSPSG